MRYNLTSNCLILGSVLMLVLFSCKKDEPSTVVDPPVTTNITGNIVLEFKPKVDTTLLVFGKKYLNLNNDSFSVSKFNYFISNIAFVNSDNVVVKEVDSFHLIKHESGKIFTLNISNIPIGSYKSISFTLGVDSARNVSGVQSGDLDPSISSDMFWGWNTGYIFLKLEGNAPKVSASNKRFEYHIGGYGGINKAQRNFNLNFANSLALVKEGAAPKIQFISNVNEVFSKPVAIDFSTQYNILNQGPNAKMMADNYADMIGFFQLQNN